MGDNRNISLSVYAWTGHFCFVTSSMSKQWGPPGPTSSKHNLSQDVVNQTVWKCCLGEFIRPNTQACRCAFSIPENRNSSLSCVHIYKALPADTALMAVRTYCENREQHALLVLNKAGGSELWCWLTFLLSTLNIRTTPAGTLVNHQGRMLQDWKQDVDMN